MWSTSKKSLCIIELTVPWEAAVVEAYKRKLLKYSVYQPRQYSRMENTAAPSGGRLHQPPGFLKAWLGRQPSGERNQTLRKEGAHRMTPIWAAPPYTQITQTARELILRKCGSAVTPLRGSGELTVHERAPLAPPPCQCSRHIRRAS